MKDSDAMQPFAALPIRCLRNRLQKAAYCALTIRDGGASHAISPTLPEAAFASLTSASSPFGLDALANAAGFSANFAPPSPEAAPPSPEAAPPSADAAFHQPRNSLVAAITAKAAAIAKENSPEEASGETRRVIKHQMSILEQERDRLAPVASREHWIALIFAVVSGSVFLATIALAVFASGRQALISLVSSVLPGFLSAVFFSRETKVESRIADIASDLRHSERTHDKVAILEELLKIFPPESRAKLAAAGAEILS